MMRKYTAIAVVLCLIMGLVSSLDFAKGKGDLPPGQAKKENAFTNGPPDPTLRLAPEKPGKPGYANEFRQQKPIRDDVYQMPPVNQSVYGPIKQRDRNQDLRMPRLDQTVYGAVYQPQLPEPRLPSKTANPNQPVKKLEGLIALLKAAGVTPDQTTAVGKKGVKNRAAANSDWLNAAVARGLITQTEMKKLNANAALKRGELEAYLKKLGLKSPPSKPVIGDVVYAPAAEIAQTVYGTPPPMVGGSVYGAPAPSPVSAVKPRNPNSPVTWSEFEKLVNPTAPEPQ